MLQPNPLRGPLDDTGVAPHLLDLLWAEYCTQLAKTASVGNTVAMAALTPKVRAIDFIDWAKRYLVKFPPVDSFFVEGGAGLRLANQKLATVGGTPLPEGSMAPGGQGSVAITPGGRPADSIETDAVGV